jgi:hypothetical protein
VAVLSASAFFPPDVKGFECRRKHGGCWIGPMLGNWTLTNLRRWRRREDWRQEDGAVAFSGALSGAAPFAASQ